MKPGHFGTAVVVSGLDKGLTIEVATIVEREVRAFGADADIVNADGTVTK